MALRVTQGMLNMQLVRNLNANYMRFDKWQEQSATGRKINRPSDDPVGITYSLRYRSELSANVQYQKNVDAALSWLGFTDTLLNQAGDVLQRARELSVNAANGTNPDNAMDAIMQEMVELKQQLIDVANSKLNGKYVFNGQFTDQQPYPSVDDVAAGITAAGAITDPRLVQFEVSLGVKMPVNLTGNDVFGQPNANDNAFAILDDLITALSNNNHTDVSAILDRMDTRMDEFLSIRAEIGAKVNRIELMESRLTDLSLNLETLQGKTEDADLAELIMRLKMDENIYQAALSAGSRIIRPSLVDFLR